MVLSCVVVGCTNRMKTGSGLAFHRIPKDAQRRAQWMRAINRKDWTSENSGDRVCGAHFQSGCAKNDPQDPDYVPHINMGYDKESMTSPELKKKRYDRYRKRVEDKTKMLSDINERDNHAENLLELADTQPLREEDQEGVSHATCDTEVSEKFTDIHDHCIKSICKLKREKQQLLDELNTLQDELRDVRQQVAGLRFRDSFLSAGNKDARTLFYTGVPSHAAFMWLLGFCTCILPTSTLLNPGSVLMLVLMKLRLNCADQDLAFRFGISRQHVGDLINSTFPVLAKKLGFLIQWPAKEEVLHHMPQVIRRTYSKCRVIIDCCEVFIERPGNFTARAMTWSNYKSHNTIKLLVAISPVGAVTFVSRAFGGRVSDKVITQRSGFLQMLEHGDLVLADRGFLISDDLAACGAQLAIPAFTRGKSQLSPRDIETGRKLACVRIHVERAIERLKNFKVLSTMMKINLVPHIDNIVTICSAISNLHPKLVN